MIRKPNDEEKIAESPTKPENGEEAPESSAQGLTTVFALCTSAVVGKI